MTDSHEHLWYTRREGLVRGPFPQRQITHYLLLGRIREDDELSTDRQSWQTIQDLPHLLPEEMQNLESEEDRQRLHAARMRADERRGGDRRFGSERMQADNGERRRESDRRADEDYEMLRHREIRRNILDEGRLPSVIPCGPQCVKALVAALALIAIIGWFTPRKMETASDCNAPAGPHVNWANCRLPGLTAEQANLRGVQARNMDLTGAHLVGSNLIGADLAYTTLNLADLRRVDLSNARLTGAGLRNADLRGARLAAVDFSYADLRGVKLDGAILTEARFDHAIWVDGRTCQPGSVAQCLIVGTVDAVPPQ